MSYAVTALILLRLRDHAGQWLDVADLARYMAVSTDVVCLELECLAAAGEVDVQRDQFDCIRLARIAPDAPADTAAPTPAPHPLPQRAGLERIERPSGAPAGHSHPTEEPVQ